MKYLKPFLLVLFLFQFVLTSIGSSDSLEIKNNEKLFQKYLKLSGDEQFQLSERKLFSQKAIDIALELDNKRNLMEAYSSNAYIDAQQGHYADAFLTFSVIKKMSDSVGYSSLTDWRRKAYIANIMGLLYKELGEYDKAIESYYSSFAISDSIKWTEGIAAALNNISVLYNIHGNTQQAISILKESWKIIKDSGLDNMLFDLSINLLDMYIEIAEYDSAGLYGQKALQIAKRINSPYNQAYVKLGFGKLFLAQEDYKNAESFLNETIELTVNKGFEELKLEAYITLAEVYRLQGKLQFCDSILLLAYTIDKNLSIPSLHVKLLIQFSKLYELERNYELAFEYYQKGVHLKDSMDSNWEKVKYAEIGALNQIKLEKQRNKVLEKDLTLKKLQLKHQRLIIIVSLIFLIILSWLLALLYRKRKFEKKTNQLLHTQNEKIRKQENIISIKNEQSLKQELDYKNRQLTSLSLSAVKQSESLDIISQQLSQLVNRHNIKLSTKTKLEEILQNLRPHKSEKEWDEFQSYFEEVHPSFYENLLNCAPDLSLNEQKICAYLRLGMNTKDIASITFRQLRSVESTRFRIRKKLGLTANQSLFEYLAKL